MPIDPSIALSIKPPQIDNPLDIYQKVQNIRYNQQLMETNASLEAERQQKLRQAEREKAIQTKVAQMAGQFLQKDPATGAAQFNVGAFNKSLTDAGFADYIPEANKFIGPLNESLQTSYKGKATALSHAISTVKETNYNPTVAAVLVEALQKNEDIHPELAQAFLGATRNNADLRPIIAKLQSLIPGYEAYELDRREKIAKSLTKVSQGETVLDTTGATQPGMNLPSQFGPGIPSPMQGQTAPAMPPAGPQGAPGVPAGPTAPPKAPTANGPTQMPPVAGAVPPPQAQTAPGVRIVASVPPTPKNQEFGEGWSRDLNRNVKYRVDPATNKVYLLDAANTPLPGGIDKSHLDPSQRTTMENEAIRLADNVAAHPNDVTTIRTLLGLGGEMKAVFANRMYEKHPEISLGMIERRAKFLDEYEKPNSKSAFTRRNINNIIQHASEFLSVIDKVAADAPKFLSSPLAAIQGQYKTDYEKAAMALSAFRAEISAMQANGFSPKQEEIQTLDRLMDIGLPLNMAREAALSAIRLSLIRANSQNEDFKGMMNGQDDPNMIHPATVKAATALPQEIADVINGFGSGGQVRDVTRTKIDTTSPFGTKNKKK